MSKNIVICSDGTGNSDTGVSSNVKRLFDLLVQDKDKEIQVAKYDKGVGTELRKDGEDWVAYKYEHLMELGFGEGVSQNLLELYTYLIEQYKRGDRVYLFGFSRGAFTVRALAGMVQVCGLLRPETISLASQAVQLYEGSEARIVRERQRRGLPPAFGPDETDHGAMDLLARDFKGRNSQPCTVDFLGIWDTVKAYGKIIPKSFPALRHNPTVKIVRHAVALDERRALYQMTGWGDRTEQVKEVWFAGDHSDVGGGYKKGNPPLADAALRWMLGEANQKGLRLDPQKKSDFTKYEEGSLEAPRTAPKDLWLRRGFVALDLAPRVELDNHDYPPRRLPRVLWSDGARKPGDHCFGDTVFVHHTVETRRRTGDDRYTHERLVRRSKPREGEIQFELKVVSVPDLKIPCYEQAS